MFAGVVKDPVFDTNATDGEIGNPCTIHMTERSTTINELVAFDRAVVMVGPEDPVFVTLDNDTRVAINAHFVSRAASLLPPKAL
jgi:hypothetical protein